MPHIEHCIIYFDIGTKVHNNMYGDYDQHQHVIIDYNNVIDVRCRYAQHLTSPQSKANTVHVNEFKSVSNQVSNIQCSLYIHLT